MVKSSEYVRLDRRWQLTLSSAQAGAPATPGSPYGELPQGHMRGAGERCRKGARWLLVTVSSVAPSMRELEALASLHKLPEDLLGEILRPRGLGRAPGLETSQEGPSQEGLSQGEHRQAGRGSLRTSGKQARLQELLAQKADGFLPHPFVAALRARCNPPQFRAVAVASLAAGRFCLVQGPPGTGKTRTVLAIISALLVQAAKRASSSLSVSSTSLSRPRAPIGRPSNSGQGAGAAQRARVLVCAQSNAAVDEILLRLLSDGLVSAAGAHMRPKVVRVGRPEGVTADGVKQLVADVLAEERLRGSRDREKSEAAREKCLERVREAAMELGRLQDQRRELTGKEGADIGRLREVKEAIWRLHEELQRLKSSATEQR